MVFLEARLYSFALELLFHVLVVDEYNNLLLMQVVTLL